MITSSLYQFNGNPEDEGAWQAFVAANSASSTAEQEQAPTPSITRIIYEVFTLVVVLGALAATMLWQQTEARFTQLEAEIQTLQDSLSATANQAEVETANTPLQALPVIDTDFFRFVFDPGHTATVASVAFRIEQHGFVKGKRFYFLNSSFVYCQQQLDVSARIDVWLS